MPSNAVIFAPLVAGFLFLRFFNLTRYVSQTWDGTRLVFWTGVAGVSLFVLSRLIILHLMTGTPLGDWLHRLLLELFPGEYVGSLAGSLLLGLTLPFIGNAIVRRDRAVRWTRYQGDLFRAMLTEEVGSGRPIAVTLSDSKVYVGLVLSRPSLNPREKYFRLLPTLTGYRDQARELHLTTNYAQMIAAIGRNEVLAAYSAEELQVLLPLDQIVSARLFDEDVYRELFEHPMV